MGECRWPGLWLGMETWLLALRNGGVFGFFPPPRPGPPCAGELKPGGVGVVVAAAYDCRVGVDGLGDLGSGDGVRSRTCDKWLMILEVTVSGLKKEVVWPALKMAVRWRLPWPKEKTQKRAMHLSRPIVACVMFLRCPQNLG